MQCLCHVRIRSVLGQRNKRQAGKWPTQHEWGKFPWQLNFKT